MKTGWICATVLGGAAAFAPAAVRRTSVSSTELGLFGGGGKKDGKKPGMMDQLAMMKKAQEMAKKKQKLDSELAAMDFVGQSADSKVTVDMKFLPVTNPMDPSPEFEPKAFGFDEQWYEDASPEDISKACKEALLDGTEKATAAMTEKYQTLQGDLLEALGGGAAGAPPSQ